MLRSILVATFCTTFALSSLACDSSDPATAKDSAKAAEPKVETAKAETTKAETPKAEAPTAAAPGEKINLNTATKEQFLTVPNAGERMAHEFDEYRPYVSIAQFRKQIGKYVDAAQVAEFEKFLFVPIDPNACDTATLMQIPGLAQANAEALVAARPFADTAAFNAKLTELAGAEATAAAAALLITK